MKNPPTSKSPPAGCYLMTHGQPVPNGIRQTVRQLISDRELQRRLRIARDMRRIVAETDAAMAKLRKSKPRKKARNS